MKDAVLIKSFQSGIVLHLKEEASIEQILEETKLKFSEAKNFFGSANVVLSFQGKKLTELEELCILDTIQQNSNINIMCVTEQREDKNQHFIKILQYMERKYKGDEKEDGQFYKGNLKNREIIETDNSIVILGDVYAGSTVVSSGSIIILGSLYGTAYAGGGGREDVFIVALEMEPETLKIGDFKYTALKNKQLKREIHFKTKVKTASKIKPQIAYLKNKEITFEPITKDSLGVF